MSHPSDNPVAYVIAIQQQAHACGLLPMWTVYDHPIDMPDKFVARCYVVANGENGPTNNWITSSSLRHLRRMLWRAGLTPLARDETDDSKIVETWL
ncbi:hypothetical protein [Bradyrhizobium ottawaense]|uniref:hypothetical protein n=1 Tax=Bradyrhizobium ottawaense TaxID=931866 RepID=UPI0030F489AA